LRFIIVEHWRFVLWATVRAVAFSIRLSCPATICQRRKIAQAVHFGLKSAPDLALLVCCQFAIAEFRQTDSNPVYTGAAA
jgi:hypothetical protein